MTRSMTGFGRASFDVEGMPFAVELRCVNHRHLDVSLRLPRAFAGLEPELRRALGARFARGKLDLLVSTPPGGARADVELDRELARRYAEFARALTAEGVGGELRAAELIALPGVARVSEHALDEESVRSELVAAVGRAAQAADEMRAAEGAALERELRGRLAAVATLAGSVLGRSSEVVASARERLRKRAEQLREETGVADEGRLLQEIVIAADRMDVTEEVVRLRSHVAQFEAALDGRAGAPIGRRLEFLLQEMSREANTIGAKAADAPIAHRVVDLKTELERIREQVQNVE